LIQLFYLLNNLPSIEWGDGGGGGEKEEEGDMDVLKELKPTCIHELFAD